MMVRQYHTTAATDVIIGAPYSLYPPPTLLDHHPTTYPPTTVNLMANFPDIVPICLSGRLQLNIPSS